MDASNLVCLGTKTSKFYQFIKSWEKMHISECSIWKEKCSPRQNTLFARFTYNVVVHCTYQKLIIEPIINIKLCTEAIKERRMLRKPT